jgi:hypothetical protein
MVNMVTVISGYLIMFYLFIYLLIYGLFNDAISNSGYIVSNGRMTDELDGIWKEAVVA